MSLGPMTPLRKLCIAKGLSRQQLGTLVGVSRQTIYNIDGGHAFPSDAVLLKMAEVLEIDALELAATITEGIESRKAAA